MLYAKILNNKVEEVIHMGKLKERFSDTVFPINLTDDVLRPLGYRIVKTIPIDEDVFKQMTKDTILEPVVSYNSESDTAERNYVLVPYPDSVEERVERKWVDINKTYKNLLIEIEEKEESYKGLFKDSFEEYKRVLIELMKKEDPFTIHFPDIPDFTIVDLASAKAYKKEEVKYSFNQLSIKPRIYVPELDIYVDGGRTNLDDFTRNLDDMKSSNILTDTVKDADNDYHVEVTQEGFQHIINAIFKNGKDLLQWKWQKENEIDSILLESYETEDEAIAAVKAIEI